MAINISCAIIKRLAENPLQEKHIAVLYVMMYTSAKGCIDKKIRKNITPKLRFEVWKL